MRVPENPAVVRVDVLVAGRRWGERLVGDRGPRGRGGPGRSDGGGGQFRQFFLLLVLLQLLLDLLPVLVLQNHDGSERGDKVVPVEKCHIQPFLPKKLKTKYENTNKLIAMASKML